MCRIKDLHAGWFRIADPSVPVQSLCLKMTAENWSHARSNSDFSSLFRRIDSTKKRKLVASTKYDELYENPGKIRRSAKVEMQM